VTPCPVIPLLERQPSYRLEIDWRLSPEETLKKIFSMASEESERGRAKAFFDADAWGDFQPFVDQIAPTPLLIQLDTRRAQSSEHAFLWGAVGYRRDSGSSGLAQYKVSMRNRRGRWTVVEFAIVRKN